MEVDARKRSEHTYTSALVYALSESDNSQLATPAQSVQGAKSCTALLDVITGRRVCKKSGSALSVTIPMGESKHFMQTV